MNKHTKFFLDFFLSRFPHSNEYNCRQVTNVRLRAMDVNESFDEMSQLTAIELKKFFSRLTEENLRAWLFGLAMKSSDVSDENSTLKRIREERQREREDQYKK